MNSEKRERERKRETEKGSGKEISHFCWSWLGDVILGNITLSTTVSGKVEREDYTTVYHTLTEWLLLPFGASNMQIFAVEFYDGHYLLSKRLFCAHLRMSNQQLCIGKVTSCMSLDVIVLESVLPSVMALLSGDYTTLLFMPGSWWGGIMLLCSPVWVKTRLKPHS